MSKRVNLESSATVDYPDFSKVTQIGWRGHGYYLESVRRLERHPHRPEYAPRSISVVPVSSGAGCLDMAEITVVYRYVGPSPEPTFDEALAASEAECREQAEVASRDANSGVWWKDGGGFA